MLPDFDPVSPHGQALCDKASIRSDEKEKKKDSTHVPSLERHVCRDRFRQVELHIGRTEAVRHFSRLPAWVPDVPYLSYLIESKIEWNIVEATGHGIVEGSYVGECRRKSVELPGRAVRFWGATRSFEREWHDRATGGSPHKTRDRAGPPDSLLAEKYLLRMENAEKHFARIARNYREHRTHQSKFLCLCSS
jgi:hypothetical protein